MRACRRYLARATHIADLDAAGRFDETFEYHSDLMYQSALAIAGTV
jgi:hypothetical protein